jgi:large subunit ribosomal protein L27
MSAAGTAFRLMAQQPLLQSFQTTRTMATKKAAGSSTNGRDSAGRRLGIKVFPGLEAKAGSIIVRQRGRKFRTGEGVGMGRDHTIFATRPGIVKFTRYEFNKKRNVVHVISE